MSGQEGLASTLEKIQGLEVTTEVILADREMKFKELLNLCVGSVIEFKKLCDSPISMEISNRVLANGEVVTSKDQRFGLRVLELTPEGPIS